MPVDSAEDLYGLPLDQFTPERNALAKRLRGNGQREEAASVAKLKKPSSAAWAVNQLVRTQDKAIKALFTAGDEMVDAQAKAMSGKGSADALRAASQRQREATETLLEAAKGLLSSDGHGLAAGVLERVSETLRAAAIDEDSRQQVEDGCLSKELAFVGLGGATPAPSPPKRKKDDAAAKRKREAELKKAQQAEKRAQQEVAKAERELKDADEELKSLQERKTNAESALQEAEEALAKAQKETQRLQRGGR